MSIQLGLLGGGPRADASGRITIPLLDADPLLLWPGWLANHEELLVHLRDTLPWEQHELQTPAGLIPAPRLECWLASSAGTPYVYSGETYLSRSIADHPRLVTLREAVERATGIGFNSLFANHYRTGRDSIGFHADAEVRALGSLEDIIIASLSLGARRPFVVKHRATEERVKVDLGRGDLLLMGRRVQSAYLHAAPKVEELVEPRINLTFRRLVRAT